MFVHITIVVIGITVINITIISKVLEHYKRIGLFEKGKGKGMVGDEQVLFIILFIVLLLS